MSGDSSVWRFLGFWALTFLGFPIGGGLAYVLVRSVAQPVTGLLAGAIAGGVIGLAQWLVLRQHGVSLGWVTATAVGLGLGLFIGTAALGTSTAGLPLAARGLLAGALMGLLQWVVLRQTAPNAGWWLAIMPIAWAIGWTVTRLAGVDLSYGWANFGALGALVFVALTGGVLSRLLY